MPSPKGLCHQARDTHNQQHCAPVELVASHVFLNFLSQVSRPRLLCTRNAIGDLFHVAISYHERPATMHVSPWKEERARAVGCTAHIGKPFDNRVLLQSIADLLPN